jgi:hypothetical protein
MPTTLKALKEQNYMQNEEMSMLDAFCALKDVDETDLPRLREGKSFDVMNADQMDKAKEFRDKSNKDDTLEVIDVNADDLEHLKDNKEYIGQVILSCKKCHAKKFVDMDQLKASEADADVYNIEDECPNCHATGEGFVIEGQVGKFEGDKIEPKAVDAEEQEVVPEQDPEPLQPSEETTDTDLPAASDLPELDTSDIESDDKPEATSDDASDDEHDEDSKPEETEIDDTIDDDETDGMETDTSEDDTDEKVEAFHDDEMNQLSAIDDDDNNYFKDFDSALSDKGTDNEPL